MPKPEPALTEDDRQDVREQANRVWAHAMHEDDEFAQYGNYFLVAESLLVVAYAAILASDQSAFRQQSLLAASVIAVFGFLVTLVWAYVCHHQWGDVKAARDHAYELLPEYQQTSKRQRRPTIHPKALMTYVVPASAGIMWATLVMLTVQAGW